MKQFIGNEVYWNSLTRNFGSFTSSDDKGKRFQSDFKFEELFIGMAILNAETNTISKVTGLTSNTVETINFCNMKNRYKTGEVDENGEIQAGKLKGLLSSKNWYTMDVFNRTFKRTSFEQRFELLRNELFARIKQHNRK